LHEQHDTWVWRRYNSNIHRVDAANLLYYRTELLPYTVGRLLDDVLGGRIRGEAAGTCRWQHAKMDGSRPTVTM